MFIFKVNYKKSISEVERFLAAHRDYLDVNFNAGKLVATGPQEPRTGGIIISNVATREEADSLIKGDPFYINDIADYEVIQFHATKSNISNFEKGLE